MSKKAKQRYVTLWEMVYNNPNQVKNTPARLVVKVDVDHPLFLEIDNVHDWLHTHRDAVAKSVLKAIKNKKSKYRCIIIERIPFFTNTESVSYV